MNKITKRIIVGILMAPILIPVGIVGAFAAGIVLCGMGLRYVFTGERK